VFYKNKNHLKYTKYIPETSKYSNLLLWAYCSKR